MKEEGWVQCQVCGALYKAKVHMSEDDLYIEAHCPKCRDDTKHLYCGTDDTEIYYYYNANLDQRYY